MFILLVLSFGVSLFWSFGKFFNTDMATIERQTYSIMSGIKYLTTIAFYIAWRVTPESKQ